MKFWKRKNPQSRMGLALLILTFWLPISLPVYAQAKSYINVGSYTGNGSDNRAVNGVGFQPDVVIIKGETGQVGVIKTSTMSGDLTKPLVGNTALTANYIQSLDTDGFTVGNDARVNSNGVIYHWVAFKAASGEMKVGSYTGTGIDNTLISGVGFNPSLIFIMSSSTNAAVLRPNTSSNTFDFTNGAGFSGVGTHTSDGFYVRTDARVNASGMVYHYIAWANVAGRQKFSGHWGDNTDNRDVTGLGFQPYYLIIKDVVSNQDTVFHSGSMGFSTDATMYYKNSANLDADRIQALLPDGYQVGNDADVNKNTSDFYAAFAWGLSLPPTHVIDCTFSDWCTDAGDYCVDDEGGPNDFTSPAKLDITRFGVSSNLADRFYILSGFDDVPVGGGTAATLIDTDLDGLINFAYVVTVNGGATTVQLFSCDDTLSYGCGSAILVKTYAPSDYCTAASAGPWDNDTFTEAQLPFSDLGLPGSNVVLTALVSYSGGSTLTSPKDSIFGVGSQNYGDRVRYDTSNGNHQKIPGAATYSVSGIVYADEGGTPVGAGKTVRLLINGVDRGTATTDVQGGYIIFPSVSLAAVDLVLVYIDDDITHHGTAVTVSGGIQIVDLDIYAGHLITRQDNGGSLTNTNLSTAKGASSDADILYSVSGGALTVQGTGTVIYLPTGHSFAPGGDMTTPAMKSLGAFNGGTATMEIDGALTISGGTFTASSGTTYVAGNLSISGATFNPNSGTFVLYGADATINTGTAALNQMTVDKTNYTLTMASSLTVNGTLTVTSGILNQGGSYSLNAGSVSVAPDGTLRNRGTGSLTLGGDVTINGAIDLNGGGDDLCGSGSKIQIRSSVNGTQRPWSGSGFFDIVDVDVKDQAGTAAITAYGSTDSGNNGGNWTITTNCTGAPTAVHLISFTARYQNSGVFLSWKTGFEVDNLGFNLYREENGQLVRLTPDIIAGSALMAGSGITRRARRSYTWWDSFVPGGKGSSPKYWLEDMDLNGKRTWHGPIIPVVTSKPLPERFTPEFLSELGQKTNQKYEDYWKMRNLKEKLSQRGPAPYTPSAQIQYAGEVKMTPNRPEQLVATDMTNQWFLANSRAVKIWVQEEGWHRVSIADLRAAGLNPSASPRYLQLYTGGKEQPLLVKSAKPGRFGPQDTIEFFAQGLDTPSTDTRIYWLVEGSRPGIRLPQSDGRGVQTGPVSFPFTVELKERVFYFAALKNGEEDNFFGSVVTAQPVEKVLIASHLDPVPAGDALVEVVLQGVTKGSHRVKVLLNQAEVGEVVFQDQTSGYGKWTVPQALLLEGENLVTLSSQEGEMDVSLTDSIKLTYWHTYTADKNYLRFTAQGGWKMAIGGFTNAYIRVIDITDPGSPYEVRGKVMAREADYSLAFGVPGVGLRTLLAFSDEKVKNPTGMAANQPSAWHETGNAFDYVILSHRDFLPALAPLKDLRQSQGFSTAIIDVEDIYDEFSFGNKTPQAIKDFLGYTKAKWNRPPRFVLLVGDASLDPRNYLGEGYFDFVPTKLVETKQLETASDDWFVDFNEDGLPEMAVGRVPVRTAEEGAVVVSKIVGYGQGQDTASWISQALLVADESEGLDFEGASEAVRNLLPGNMVVRKIFRSQYGSDEQANSQLLSIMDQGSLLINYIGHGSEEAWGVDLLRSEDSQSLTNGLRLPFVITMTCLNGFFIDVYTESLAEALLKAKQGGAVAVWGSSGLTEPGGQAILNQEVIRLLFNGESLTLGETVARAKAAVGNVDIRRTWILFGDPAMRLYRAPSGISGSGSQ